MSVRAGGRPAGCTAAVRAQAPVTAADLTRLEATAAEIERQVATLKKTDPTLAAEVEQIAGGSARRDRLPQGEAAARRQRDARRVRDAARPARDAAAAKAARDAAEGDGAAAAGDEPTVSDVHGAGRHRVRHPAADAAQFGHREGRSSGSKRRPSSIHAAGGNDVVIPAGSIVRGFVSSVQRGGQDRSEGQPDALVRRDPHRRAHRSGCARRSSRRSTARSAEDVTRIGAGAVVGAHHRRHPRRRQGRADRRARRRRRHDRRDRRHRRRSAAGTILRIRVDQPLEIAMICERRQGLFEPVRVARSTIGSSPSRIAVRQLDSCVQVLDTAG